MTVDAKSGDKITVTQDGISWRIRETDYSATPRYCFGWSISSEGSDQTAWTNKNAIASGAYDAATLGDTLFLPASLTSGSTTYYIEGIGYRGMYGLQMKNLVVPTPCVCQLSYAFARCYDLRNVLYKGPVTASEGATQTLSEGLRWPDPTPFFGLSDLELVVFGPNMRLAWWSDNNTHFRDNGFSAGSPTVLMPRRADNMTWDGYAPTSHSVNHYYGPAEAFDMTMAETSVTFIPTTPTALVNTLAWAKTFKSAFDLDARISVTNRIVVSAVQVNDTAIGDAKVDPGAWHYIVFPVTTQDGLDALLAAVTVDAPLTIDVTGQAENLTVPAGREVVVLASEGKTIVKRLNGLMIIVQ